MLKKLGLLIIVRIFPLYVRENRKEKIFGEKKLVETGRLFNFKIGVPWL